MSDLPRERLPRDWVRSFEHHDGEDGRWAASFRSAIDHTSDAVSISRDGTILYANLAFAHCLGYQSPEELLGTSVHQTLHPDEREDIAWCIAEVERAHIMPHEPKQRRWLRKDGETVWVEVVGVPLYLDGHACLIAIARDVTGRRAAEESLRLSEQSFRGLVERSPDSVIVEREGEVIYINATGASRLGYRRREEVIGRPAIDLVHPQNRDLARARHRKVEGGATVPPHEIRFLRRDGTTLVGEEIVQPTTFDGRPAIVAVVRHRGAS